MTVAEILADLIVRCDDIITLADLLPWLKSCSDDLAVVAKKPEISETEWIGGESFGLPCDLVHLCHIYYEDVELVDLDLNPFKKSGYRRIGSALYLDPVLEAGTLRVEYYRTLAELTSLAHSPEIATQFHRLYVLWGADNYYRNWNLSKAFTYRSEYKALRDEFSAFMHGQGLAAPYRVKDALPSLRRSRRRSTGLGNWEDYMG